MFDFDVHPAVAADPPEFGVFGGSGFEELLEDAAHVDVETPWGPPAAAIAVGSLGGRRVAFLPRHGMAHEFPPHMVPYRANVWAMRRLGVRRLVGPCAAGSLQRSVEPGHFVVADQLVDRTKSRGDTFFDGAPEPTTHISFSDPYCADLRAAAVSACRDSGVVVHDRGTVVVVEGPRFSTRAESHAMTQAGWEVVNMTQHPEAALAREARICYANISLITDYDAGFSLDSGIPAVTVDEVVAVFRRNNEHLRNVLEALLRDAVPQARSTCACAAALDGAQL
ncbi:MAG: S-methyl-5'-thioadenosine phosphorylase [Acidimicrobiia bacterium]